jgi:hypothetical protein
MVLGLRYRHIFAKNCTDFLFFRINGLPSVSVCLTVGDQNEPDAGHFVFLLFLFFFFGLQTE